MLSSVNRQLGPMIRALPLRIFVEMEELLKERALEHTERAKVRRLKADEHKEAASRAIAEYEVAVKIHSPIAMYLLNMAVAWLS